MKADIAKNYIYFKSPIGKALIGKNKKDSIDESLRVNLQPVFMTAITTAIGFLTMHFSEAPPFRQLGYMMAFVI